jgi:hypothetical protein
MATKTETLLINLRRPQPKCIPPDGSDLTSRQEQALHTFLHEIQASLHRLYMELPPEEANTYVDKFLP